MDETDEYTPLSERISIDDARSSRDDDLLRTIEADHWNHLRATTEMDKVSETETAQHVVPPELLQASIPTRKKLEAIPKPDDARWVHVVSTVNPDGSVNLPEDLRSRLRQGERLHLRVFVDDE